LHLLKTLSGVFGSLNGGSLTSHHVIGHQPRASISKSKTLTSLFEMLTLLLLLKKINNVDTQWVLEVVPVRYHSKKTKESKKLQSIFMSCNGPA
jgi:hypothetical protein